MVAEYLIVWHSASIVVVPPLESKYVLVTVMLCLLAMYCHRTFLNWLSVQS